MGTIRLFFRDRPAIAALLLAAALCLKVLIPAGFMPAQSEGGVVVAICSGTMGQAASMTITIPKHDPVSEHGQTTADHPCAFAPLNAAMTAGNLLPLLTAALAFVFVAAVFGRPLVLLDDAPRYRPPSQGPPAFV